MTAMLSCKSSFISTNCRDCIFWTSLRGIGGKLDASEKSPPAARTRGDDMAAGGTEAKEAAVGTDAGAAEGNSEAGEGSDRLVARRGGADDNMAEAEQSQWQSQ